MNLEEFYEALSKTPRDWEIRYVGFTSRGLIRMKHCGNCPIAEVDPKVSNLSAARTELLGAKDTSEVMNAADDAKPYDAGVRRKLLEACGLHE